MQDLIDFLTEHRVKYQINDDYVVCDTLKLGESGIKELPENFGYIKCKNIELYGNQIKELPESIGNLICEYFSISNNKLTSIPDSFSKIKCEKIYFSGNAFGEIPKVLYSLKASIISLSNCGITKIPNDINLAKCEYWDFSENDIVSLDGNIGNNIKKIDFSKNKISSIANSFFSKYMLWIDISKNNLIELPEDFFDMSCDYINISHNKLKSIPDSISKLKNCHTLELFSNEIMELPDSIGKLNSPLLKVSFAGNKIEHLPSFISTLIVKQFNIASNPLKKCYELFKEWNDDVIVNFYKTEMEKHSGYIKNCRKEIDFYYDLFNNESLSGAKDCLDSGLFDFKIK